MASSEQSRNWHILENETLTVKVLSHGQESKGVI
jgi:hypothetical protein